ncbi:hypothetical protein ID866_11792 [Astraeus odoratus]|nr:hypothetical protein ID866_11792 [Astraeus odoratus]
MYSLAGQNTTSILMGRATASMSIFHNTMGSRRTCSCLMLRRCLPIILMQSWLSLPPKMPGTHGSPRGY